MERCGKIHGGNSVAERWTGIDVVAGFYANVGMVEWSRLKRIEIVS
jgi:hypothetical protein